MTIHAGAEQIGVPKDENVNVYLEDGTIITDSKFLDSDMVKGHILILGMNPPQQASDMMVCTTPGASPVIPTASPETMKAEQIRAWAMSSAVSSPSSTELFADGASTSSMSSGSTLSKFGNNLDNDINTRLIGSGLLRLPDFTSSVTESLIENDSNKVWNEVVNQTVNFYRKYYPQRLNSSEDYRLLGQLICKKFPSLSRFGKHEWSCFTHAVSSKMRSIRHQNKRNSGNSLNAEDAGSGRRGVKRKLDVMNCIVSKEGDANSTDWNTEDYKEHKKSMKEEMKKDIMSIPNAKHLLKVTFNGRKMERDTFKDRILHKTLTVAPVLERGELVSES